MAYLLKKIFKIGSARKYIVPLLILLVILSAAECFTLYIDSLELYIGDKAKMYLSRLSYRFDPDLQWKGDDFLTPLTSGDFNSDGSMDKYNEPIYTDRGLFDEIADSGYVKRYGLAYAVQAHNLIRIERDMLSDDEMSVFDRDPGLFTDNLLFGGSFSDFQWMCCGSRQIGTGLLQVDITRGREHGSGECLICGTTAERFGYDLGDKIELRDSGGNKIELEISGFFTYSVGGRQEEACDSFERLRLQYTNPFFRIGYQVMKYMVLTDFDSVYRLIPDGEHEINSYIAWYELEDYKAYDEFVGSLDITHDHQDFMKFVPDRVTYEGKTEAVKNGLSVMRKFKYAMTALMVTAEFLLMLFIVGERTPENGILCSLGVSVIHITLCRLFEITVYLTAVAFISVFLSFALAKMILFLNAYFSSLDLIFSLTPSVMLLCGTFVMTGSVFALISCVMSFYRRAPSAVLRKK